MSDLTNQKIYKSYEGVLQVPNGTTAAPQTVQDGLGANLPLQVGWNGVAVTKGMINTVWTTATRPVVLYAGLTGFNSDYDSLETWDGTKWILNAGGDASTISYTAPYTGAVQETLQYKLEQTISVKDFGAVGDGATDDTTAIQNAINTGKPIIFPSGYYLSGPLTQSTTGQRFYANGQVTIAKNQSGTLFTSTGSYVELNGLQFVGTGYTGDNIYMSGNSPRLIMCSSYGTPDIPVKLEGNHCQIIGTSGSFTTTDNTASGYDIVIGKNGVATLYHQLIGIYTSHSTGGIRFIDTGGSYISGGQFGKLSIEIGNAGYQIGCSAGQVIGSRITGNVNIYQSNGSFVGNQFAGTTVTINSGLTNVNFDNTNNFSTGTTFYNNSGNPNNISISNGYDAAAPFVNKLKFGDSNSLTWLGYEPSSGLLYTPAGMYIGYSGSQVVYVGGSADLGAVYGGTGGLYLGGDYAAQYQAEVNTFRPTTDGLKSLGSAGQKWSVVYAATGTINTSDENEKTEIRSLTLKEKSVALAIKNKLKAFKFKDSVEQKGESARIHFGVLAQDVKAAFELEGLNANDYGLFCYDEWETQQEKKDQQGNIVAEATMAGNRYGIRYDELMAFILGSI